MVERDEYESPTFDPELALQALLGPEEYEAQLESTWRSDFELRREMEAAGGGSEG